MALRRKVVSKQPKKIRDGLGGNIGRTPSVRLWALLMAVLVLVGVKASQPRKTSEAEMPTTSIESGIEVADGVIMQTRQVAEYIPASAMTKTDKDGKPYTVYYVPEGYLLNGTTGIKWVDEVVYISEIDGHVLTDEEIQNVLANKINTSTVKKLVK